MKTKYIIIFATPEGDRYYVIRKRDKAIMGFTRDRDKVFISVLAR